MHICPWCEQDTKRTASCTVQSIEFPDGVKLPPLAYEPEAGAGPCQDCGAPPGGIHHPGCEIERCPRCSGQLLSCGCMEPRETD
jgi:hypothetical protein